MRLAGVVHASLGFLTPYGGRFVLNEPLLRCHVDNLSVVVFNINDATIRWAFIASNGCGVALVEIRVCYHTSTVGMRGTDRRNRAETWVIRAQTFRAVDQLALEVFVAVITHLLVILASHLVTVLVEVDFGDVAVLALVLTFFTVDVSEISHSLRRRQTGQSAHSIACRWYSCVTGDLLWVLHLW